MYAKTEYPVIAECNEINILFSIFFYQNNHRYQIFFAAHFVDFAAHRLRTTAVDYKNHNIDIYFILKIYSP